MIINLSIINRVTGLLLVAQLSVLVVTAQENLLLNGDFEQLSLMDVSKATIDGVPLQYAKRDTALLWHLINRDNVSVSATNWDYSTDSTLRRNAWYSDSGRSHSGCVYDRITPFFTTRRESGVYYIGNIVGELCKPLTKNNTYELSFWIRPFKGNYYVNSIDVHFDSTRHHFNGYVRYRKRKKKERKKADWIEVENSTPTPLPQDCVIDLPSKDESKYVQVNSQYKAKGGEKYIYIGNLTYNFPRKFKKKNLKVYGEQSPSPVPTCVYAIDDVNLISKTDTTEKCDIQPPRFVSNKGIDIPFRDPTAAQQMYQLVLDDNDFENFKLKPTQKTTLESEFGAIDFRSVKYITITEYHDKLTGFSVKDMPLKYIPAIKEILLPLTKDIKIYTSGNSKEKQEEGRVNIWIYYK